MDDTDGIRARVPIVGGTIQLRLVTDNASLSR